MEKEVDKVEGESEDKPASSDSPENILDVTKELVKSMRAENDRKEKLVEREEKIAALSMLGGTTEGRGAPVNKVDPDSKEGMIAYANQLWGDNPKNPLDLEL